MFRFSFCFLIVVAAVSALKCPKLKPVEHGKFEFYKYNGWPAEICRVIYHCDIGYSLNGHHDLYCYVGKWSSDPPTCEVNKCDDLPELSHGSHRFVGDVPEALLFSVAEYSCDAGYEMAAGSRDYARVCMPDGSWSGEMPECTPIDCDFSNVTCEVLPNQIEHGSVRCNDSNNYDSECTVTCDTGFGLDEAKTVKCLAGDGETGEWDEGLPTCVEI